MPPWVPRFALSRALLHRLSCKLLVIYEANLFMVVSHAS